MQLQLRYFAGLREVLGLSAEQVTLPATCSCVQDILAALRLRGGIWAEALADGAAFRIAVDQRMADASSPVRSGAEVAFFPPVTGG
ncbi:Molybdopterin synthase sulfur carrier subunit [Massilia sp. Bi118]|uniref:molybdopterin converting factor subunit 1 n=1 Tax=Massilia sp. Bi118 TaxID=2822346 RepID=UPI001D1E3E76|nr:molybdopterin converting factor subunit 1 [Massilia sp. Bi118]CAH0181159.1 Molybdopterin synthase sulfur carrier subunit [Massilia sp. Bi118]